MSVQIAEARSIGLNNNYEMLEWHNTNENNRNNKDNDKSKGDYSYLHNKPTIEFMKIKFGKLIMNSTICMGLDGNFNIYLLQFTEMCLSGEAIKRAY